MSGMTMTAEEFMQRVLDVAAECGYAWMADGKHHPEDLAVNLGPIMHAYAAGYGDGYRRGVGK